MNEAQEQLNALEAQRRARDFNTEYAQAAMEYVFGERRRQVRKGRNEEIQYPCEAAATADIYRLGVLTEEVGEVATAIIERQGLEAEFDEYCHVAAVALACMEGLMRKMGVTIRSDGMADNPHVFVGTNENAGVDDKQGHDDPAVRSIHGHEDVLNEALAIYAGRMGTRGELWRRLGVRGQLMNMRVCMERLWERYWTMNPGSVIDMDDALDLLNYTVFMVRLLREGEPPEVWRYPDGK